MSAINFFWDGDNLLQEYDDSGNTLAHYVTEPQQFGNVISQRRNGETWQLHFDGLGSTMELTDGADNVTDGQRYMAFGEVAERFGTTEFPFQFIGRVGYYLDEECSSCYVRHRSYEVSSGRWLSLDPLGPRRLRMHRYNYVSTSPLSSIDPSGLFDTLLDCETKPKGPLLNCASRVECTICPASPYDFIVNCIPGLSFLLFKPCADTVEDLCCRLGNPSLISACLFAGLQDCAQITGPLPPTSCIVTY